MIKYDLKCTGCAHQFEGWFPDSAGFDSQVSAGEVLCPVCASPDIGKAIMAPNIATGISRSADMPMEQITAEAKRVMADMRQHVEDNCEYVGQAFPEEARKIHFGETHEREIYGEASAEEARDLIDEGIDVAPIPWIPRSDA